MSAAELVAERLPSLVALLEEARDAVWELADLLSDAYADVAADQGLVGHRTPARVLKVYAAAEELDRVAERLGRVLR